MAKQFLPWRLIRFPIISYFSKWCKSLTFNTVQVQWVASLAFSNKGFVKLSLREFRVFNTTNFSEESVQEKPWFEQMRYKEKVRKRRRRMTRGEREKTDRAVGKPHGDFLLTNIINALHRLWTCTRICLFLMNPLLVDSCVVVAATDSWRHRAENQCTGQRHTLLQA